MDHEGQYLVNNNQPLASSLSQMNPVHSMQSYLRSILILFSYIPKYRIPVGRDFPPVQTGPGAHPASCAMGTGSFAGVKYGRGVLLTTHPLLVPRSWKSRAIPLPTLWATTGPVTGTIYHYIPKYLEFSPSCRFSHQPLCAILVSPSHDNIIGIVTRKRPWLPRSRG